MLACLTGLLLTLGGEGPAIVFIPPLDPEVFDWNPDDLSLRFVGEVDGQGPRFDFVLSISLSGQLAVKFGYSETVAHQRGRDVSRL